MSNSTKTDESEPPSLGNRDFTKGLGTGLLALLCSAVALVALYLMLSPELAHQKASVSRDSLLPWTFDGADLITRMGKTQENDDGSLSLIELEDGVDNRAILTRRAGLRAEDYPFLEYNLSNRHAAKYVYFIWRTEDNPGEVHNIALHWSGNKPTMVLLDSEQEWRGKIIEVGLDIYGDLRGQPLIVNSLTLTPSSKSALAQSIWQEWNAFSEWTQRSAHFLTSLAAKNPTLSPTPAIAAWAGTALLLLTALKLLSTPPNLIAYATVIFLPWIALDLLWQKNIIIQLTETKHLFSGKTQQQKHLADIDNELYSYAQHLKEDALPEPGAKIYLLHDSERRGYRRLKAQYYLLPHNTFNFGKLPRPDHLIQGDYLLVLDTIPGLEYDSDSQSLHWGSETIDVELIDDRAPGMLFRYRGKHG